MDRKPCPTDLTDAQWRRIKPWIPGDAPTGRPPKCSKREILDAVLYVPRNGCTWRALPHDLPPFTIVFHWFRKWQADGTWRRIHDQLRERVRRKAGKTPKPTAAVLDSQTVKTTEQGAPRAASMRGKAVGRKRHVVVDTLGLVWALVVTPADVQDRDGAMLALEAFRESVKFPKSSGPIRRTARSCAAPGGRWLGVVEFVSRPPRPVRLAAAALDRRTDLRLHQSLPSPSQML